MARKAGVVIMNILLQHCWYIIPWVATLIWVHFRFKKQQFEINKKLLNNEEKLDSALEKLDIGISEVKNRTRCKMLDRDARRQ